MNTINTNSVFSTILENETKRGKNFLLTVLGISLLVAIGQSIRFSSSLWVVVKFGIVHWQDDIVEVLDNIVMWAILTGIVFAIEAFINSSTTEIKNLLVGLSFSFGIGFASPYLFVLIVGFILYIPLGLFSFIFPDKVYFLSMGFAILCSTYIVFSLIAIDTPRFLVEIIKTTPIYLKILAALLLLRLALQASMMVLSILRTLMEYSIWRVHPPAFIIAFGVTLITTIVINLVVLRGESKYKKITIIVSVYLLSIITGNITENLFHWGEYSSAFVAAIISPIVYSYLLNIIQKNIVITLPALAGLVGGLGTGFFITHYSELSIIGQGWFGILCGTSIALGFGISFGFLLGPSIGEFITKFLRLKPVVGFLITTGFIAGTIMGIVIGGFVNR